jgi:hypothetical protein
VTSPIRVASGPESGVAYGSTAPEPGIQSADGSRGERRAGQADRMKVELYFWEGCPSYPEAEALLADVLQERGIEARIERREVRSQGEAEELVFPGSPTIRIDGRDIDPEGASARPALACRIYRLSDGRISPIPARETLEAALT